jgi:hypothetical protein
VSFRIELGEVTLTQPAELLRLVLLDARAGGSTVVEGVGPHRWVLDARDQGRLPDDLVVRLSAALLERGRPEGLAVGARLAQVLDNPGLAAMIGLALTTQDTATLLAPDPLAPAQSVEDSLLQAAVTLIAHVGDEQRGALLLALRNTGATHLEVEALCRSGSAEEVLRWLPSALADLIGTDEHARIHALVAQCAAEDGERAEAFRAVMRSEPTHPGDG